MKRALLVVAIVLGLLAATAGGAYYWLSRPVPTATFDEPGPSPEVKMQRSLVESVLRAAGVEAALVDVTPERAYVAYDAPDGVERDLLQIVAMQALAGAAPESGTGIAVLYEAGTPALMWEGDLAALRAVGEDEAKFDAWLAAVEKTEL